MAMDMLQKLGELDLDGLDVASANKAVLSLFSEENKTKKKKKRQREEEEQPGRRRFVRDIYFAGTEN